MHFPWAELLLAASAALSATPGNTQQIGEAGIQGIVTASDPALAVVGAYGALRTSGRTRFSASVGGGASDGEFAWRAEALGHFLLSPGRRRGWGAYLWGPRGRRRTVRSGVHRTQWGRGTAGGSSGGCGGCTVWGQDRSGVRWRRFPRTGGNSHAGPCRGVFVVLGLFRPRLTPRQGGERLAITLASIRSCASSSLLSASYRSAP